MQMEMAGQDYVTAIMTAMDGSEGYTRLAESLMEIDAELSKKRPETESEKKPGINPQEESLQPEAEYSIHEAWERCAEKLPLEQCEGEVSAEFVHIYPPGIPLIAPGERFTTAVVEQLLCYREQGLTIEGLHEENKTAGIIRRENYEKNKNYLYNRTGE